MFTLDILWTSAPLVYPQANQYTRTKTLSETDGDSVAAALTRAIAKRVHKRPIKS
ncbi:hypothetical protein KT99_11485 [Shewanella benthica KT99]|uniref:Uncharacterized protein n=1 Tax=Shewanella benthica KT99 TaxID=314608 RepID=A9EKI8_9GAMM|nr:hypothetical protein KT99_11485 [Shewanella benthica KT99]